jgi:hypothetical protein
MCYNVILSSSTLVVNQKWTSMYVSFSFFFKKKIGGADARYGDG